MGIHIPNDKLGSQGATNIEFPKNRYWRLPDTCQAHSADSPPRGPSLTAADADGGSGTVLLMPTPWLPGPSNQAGSDFTKAVMMDPWV